MTFGHLVLFAGLVIFSDILDELQEHVESIDMANGEFFDIQQHVAYHDLIFITSCIILKLIRD